MAPGVTAVDPGLLADVATGLWRARGKLVDPASGEPLPAGRGAHRHVQRTLEVLARAGVEVVDHQGADFVAGVVLDVVAFQPVPGLTREVVIEVVRPSVYVGGVLVQRGEVIVGTPVADGSGATA